MPQRNPFEDIERMFDRMNQELEQFGKQLEGEFVGDVDVDVAETDDEVTVVADLPGFSSSEISVSVANRELTLSAEHDEETEAESGDESDRRYHRRERSHRHVTRRLKLPADVVEEEADATYNNGVLTVTLPKAGGGDEDGTHIDVE